MIHVDGQRYQATLIDAGAPAAHFAAQDLGLDATGSEDAAQRRLWLMLALGNTTIPSVLMLLLVLLR